MSYKVGDYYRDKYGCLLKIIYLKEDNNLVQIEIVSSGVSYWVNSACWLVPISSLEKALL